MKDYAKQIEEAVRAVKKRTDVVPQVGIILGTGLEALADDIRTPERIAYADIPNFPTATVTTHKAEYVFGTIGGKTVCAMAGRFHKYQGYTMPEITLPVWVMHRLGMRVLIVSNACGGMREDHAPGDLFIIEDHINLLGENPLTGLDEAIFGNLFVDMLDPYDRELMALAGKIAKAEGVTVRKGVYVAVPGPNLETRAEYVWLRTIGADAVGMSTVPEVLVARQCGVRCLGLACITDRCLPGELEPVDIARIIRTATDAEPKFTRLGRHVIHKFKP
jgi:purine-nucleoside phosphorylase